MKSIKLLMTLLATLMLSSCYEDYIDDYEYSSVYFSSQKPLRTVIADRDMSIKVGVAIGGKRTVDMSDYAEFQIDESLLAGTGLTLLPSKYYTLSDPSIMRVSKSTLPVADVTINFTEDFYNDANSAKQHFALPFRIVNSSLDSVLVGKETSVVAIKYISTYHGTYYVKGSKTDVTTGKVTTYSNADLSQNIYRNLVTVNRNTLEREGLADFVYAPEKSYERVKIEFNPDGQLTVGTADKCVTINNGSGTYSYDSDGVLTLDISYEFISPSDNKTYRVKEQLIRRQDPLQDLRFEEWSAISSSGEGPTEHYIKYKSDGQLIADGYYTEYDFGNKEGWVYLPTGEIPNDMFKSKALVLEELEFVGIEKIGNYAFGNPDGNAALKNTIGKLIFTEGLKSIGNNAFNNVTIPEGGSKILQLPNSLETLGEQAFRNLGITGVVFGNAKLGDNGKPQESEPKLTTISKNCFGGCGALTGNVVIPSSVTSMTQAFTGKHKELNLYFMSETAPTDIVGAGDFNSNTSEISITIYVPKGAKSSYSVWGGLNGITLTEWETNN